jgi:hypothetical protein
MFSNRKWSRHISSLQLANGICAIPAHSNAISLACWAFSAGIFRMMESDESPVGDDTHTSTPVGRACMNTGKPLMAPPCKSYFRFALTCFTIHMAFGYVFNPNERQIHTLLVLKKPEVFSYTSGLTPQTEQNKINFKHRVTL